MILFTNTLTGALTALSTLSGHGPIHIFKDKHITLPEEFDDEYFRHMQWAHMASGAAGGGMRWPNRHPHILTQGMRRAQKSLSEFSKLINWKDFQRQNLNQEVKVSDPAFAVFACGDKKQALLWVLRKDILGADGTLTKSAAPKAVHLQIPQLEEGTYQLTSWHTERGEAIAEEKFYAAGSTLAIAIEVVGDIALLIRIAP